MCASPSVRLRSLPWLPPRPRLLVRPPPRISAITRNMSFAEGLTHPFTGLDHMLAMVAVGLWASQIGGRALWLLPLTFPGG